jgi:predicted metalloprotease
MDVKRAQLRPALAPLALAVVAASVVALAGAWVWGFLHPARFEATEVADRGRADAIMRRTEAAFSDAQAVWTRTADRYAPARVIFFSRATETACAGGATVAGPFYCPDTGTAAFDLAFLAVLAGRLQRNEELGVALIAARISAGHLQHELGLLDAAALRLIGAGRDQRAAVGKALQLQGDCLTGAWAAAAGKRLGPVPEKFWSQLVWSWRNVVADRRAEGLRLPPEFDVFAHATQDERQAAFSQGLAGGTTACPPPTAVVARG